jgi:hypothetical protein
MKAVLRRMHSPDVRDLERFMPDSDVFVLLVQFLFGSDENDGEESFDAIVCSPKWIEKKVDELGIMDARHHIIMKQFDIKVLREFVTEFSNGCSGEKWEDVAEKLARLGHWEFEDYRSFVP